MDLNFWIKIRNISWKRLTENQRSILVSIVMNSINSETEQKRCKFRYFVTLNRSTCYTQKNNTSTQPRTTDHNIVRTTTCLICCLTVLFPEWSDWETMALPLQPKSNTDSESAENSQLEYSEESINKRNQCIDVLHVFIYIELSKYALGRGETQRLMRVWKHIRKQTK